MEIKVWTSKEFNAWVEANSTEVVFNANVRGRITYIVLRRTFYYQLIAYRLDHDTELYTYIDTFNKYSCLADAVDGVAMFLKKDPIL